MYRKFLSLLICILSFAIPSFAQLDTDASDSTYWDFGLYVSPDFNGRMISGNGSNGVTSSFLNSIEMPRMGYSIGGVVTRQLGKKLFIQTGIIYESQGYKTKALQDTVLDLYDKFLYAKTYHKAVHYNALQIPVILKIKLFSAGKTQFLLGIGAAPEFFLNKTVLSVFSDHTGRVVSKAERDVEVQGLINLNVNIPLTKKMSLGIEPNFKYSILGFKDAADIGIKRNLFSAGLALQLCYKITDKDFYDYYYLHIYKKPPKTNF